MVLVLMQVRRRCSSRLIAMLTLMAWMDRCCRRCCSHVVPWVSNCWRRSVAILLRSLVMNLLQKSAVRLQPFLQKQHFALKLSFSSTQSFLKSTQSPLQIAAISCLEPWFLLLLVNASLVVSSAPAAYRSSTIAFAFSKLALLTIRAHRSRAVEPLLLAGSVGCAISDISVAITCVYHDGKSAVEG